MRSTIIIATFALAVIAAPIPEAKPIFKGNGEGCVRRIGSKCSIRTRDNTGDFVDTDVEASFAKPDTQSKNRARSPYIRSKSVNQRDIAQDGADDLSDYTVQVEQRSPAMSRNKNSRSTEEDEKDDLLEYPEHIEQRSPAMSRNKNSRSAEVAEVEDLSSQSIQIEQRSPAMSRNKNSRDVEDEQEDVSDDSAQIKQRSPAMSRNKNSRSAELDEVEDLSSQSIQIEQRSPAMSRNKNSRSAEEDEDEDDNIEARASKENNARSADPITRNGHRSIDLTVAEDEQSHNEARSIRGGGSNKRSAKPEPINRSMHSREPENTMS